MHRHNGPAAKSKLSVETPNWGPGQPLRGRLLYPLQRHGIRVTDSRHRQECPSTLSVATEAISVANDECLPLQSLYKPCDGAWQAASWQEHWAIYPPSPGYRAVASVKTLTAWALSEWQSSLKSGHRWRLQPSLSADGCCHGLPSQHRLASQRTTIVRRQSCMAHRRGD